MGHKHITAWLTVLIHAKQRGAEGKRPKAWWVGTGFGTRWVSRGPPNRLCEHRQGPSLHTSVSSPQKPAFRIFAWLLCVEGQQDNLCKVPGEGQAFLKVPISGASSTHYTGTGVHSCHLAECPLNPLWGRRGWCGEVA